MQRALLPLLHLADSALPVGSFAFSSGLEAAAKTGVVRDSESLHGYILAGIEQAASFDLPFLNTFHRGGEVAGALVAYDATMTVPEMRRASRAQARGLLRLLAKLYAARNVAAVADEIAAAGTPLHYLPALGLSLSRIGIAVEDARRLHLFCVLRDQFSAAIRLNLVGPVEGHALQAGLFGHCEDLQQRSAGKFHDAAFRTAPLIDLVQGCHARLYSRLFQN